MNLILCHSEDSIFVILNLFQNLVTIVIASTSRARSNPICFRLRQELKDR
ncbi:MAG: hypothetical protein ABIL02_05630 [candidate division WOR-3 bacterium]